MGAAADNDLAGDLNRSWYRNEDQIERDSPSRRDGINAACEAELRRAYARFIRDLCSKLGLPNVSCATAILLCQRFYLRQSLAKNDWQTIATVCIFLASKIEDMPCKLKHLVIVAYEMMYKEKIQKKEVLRKQMELILVGETLLMSTIEFDLDIQIPFVPLELALNNLGMNLGITKWEVTQTAGNIIIDTLSTTLALQFKPNFIAAGSLFVAAKFHSFTALGGNWCEEFGVAPKELLVVMNQMSDLCKHRDRRFMGPAINPTPAPTPMDAKKMMISTPSPVINAPHTPDLVDEQQITSTQGRAQKHAQSSSTKTSKSVTNSISGSARDIAAVNQRSESKQISSPQGLTLKHAQSSSTKTSKSDTKSICSSTRDTAAVNKRSEKQSSSRTLRDVTNEKRGVHEIGGYPAWKRQKLGSNEDAPG